MPLPETILDILAAIVFALALTHAFSAGFFERLARRQPAHAGLWHLLGEIEVVFGFWGAVLVATIALVQGGAQAITYAESRQYAEPLFVFVVMVVSASRPVLQTLRRLLYATAAWLPLPTALARAWLCLALVPLLGSLVTEPAAMTLAALMLAPLVFRPDMPERLKYAALGTLFVNISIGGLLTSFAAPPVLMVATTWGWDSAFMASHFGWKAAIAVLINASALTWMLRRHLASPALAAAGAGAGADDDPPVPPSIVAVHLGVLAAVVLLAHHPVMFLGVFLFFLGFAQAYARHQSPLILKEALLVGFFLAGLVVLGGQQQWWLQPLVAGLEPLALFFGALGLTAITDNAALTYLGSLVSGLSEPARYMLVAGAVAGGGLTVIANAPNPAGVALLKQGFADGAVDVLPLLLGALLPTVVAAALLLLA